MIFLGTEAAVLIVLLLGRWFKYQRASTLSYLALAVAGFNSRADVGFGTLPDRRPASSMQPLESPLRFPGAVQAGCLLLLPCIAGCSPYVEFGGAYFPAWLLSLLLGCAASAALRTVLVRKGIDSLITPHAIAWPSIITALSASFWLVLFSQ
jgi:hypothetical protein